ncbi:hypothetical protein, partial [Klebsiella pneumoniae]
RAYCLKTQPATGETYPKSDLFNKAQQALMTHHNFLRNFPSSGISVNGFRLTMRPLYQENHAELLPFVC